MDYEEVKRKAIEEMARHWKESQIGKINGTNNCLHDNCEQCHGTGIKVTGGVCIHMISCTCTKCRIC